MKGFEFWSSEHEDAATARRAVVFAKDAINPSPAQGDLGGPWEAHPKGCV